MYLITYDPIEGFILDKFQNILIHYIRNFLIAYLLISFTVTKKDFYMLRKSKLGKI